MASRMAPRRRRGRPGLFVGGATARARRYSVRRRPGDGRERSRRGRADTPARCEQSFVSSAERRARLTQTASRSAV